MKKLKYNLLTILFIAFVAVFPSCINGSESIKVQNWQILYDDDGSLEKVINNTGWKPVSVPSTFKLQYSPVKEFRHVWMAAEFNINDNPADYYGISSGRIRLTDRLLINNKFIDSLPIEDISWNPLPRNYVIPGNILTPGKYLSRHIRQISRRHYGRRGSADREEL